VDVEAESAIWSGVVRNVSTRHDEHTIRTRRWATTPTSVDDRTNGSTPSSSRRVTALAASFVWSVARTM
jgi:hypothetical protein